MAWTSASATPLSMPAAAFVGLDIAAVRAEPVAARRKPVRSTAKSRKSGGVSVTTGDLDGDGTPDTVTTKPKKTKLSSKPTSGSKPTRTPTGGVNVQ
jgi:hypothetical protein